MSADDRGQTEERVLYGFWISPYMSLVAQFLLESEIGFRYERVSPYVGGTLSGEHKARNLLEKIPSLREPGGLYISESQAICRYLSRTYPDARRFYPCDDAVRCAAVDAKNDFITFSVSGPFFEWFVAGAYYPKAFRLKTEAESQIFSIWSFYLIRDALGRLVRAADLQPFLLGSEPCLPDFHLFHVLELSRTFSKIFDMPLMNLLAGNEALEKFHEAMTSRAASKIVLAAQADELALTTRELFEEFGLAYGSRLNAGKGFLRTMFGHEI